jgi:hypothetical protein
MLEEQKTNIDQLLDHTEEYLKTRQQLSKLVVAEKASIVASSLFSSVIIFGVFFFMIVFASIALAYAFAMYFGETMYGFLAVTGLYLIAGILVVSNRKKWLETPVTNMVIKNFLKDEDDGQN